MVQRPKAVQGREGRGGETHLPQLFTLWPHYSNYGGTAVKKGQTPLLSWPCHSSRRVSQEGNNRLWRKKDMDETVLRPQNSHQIRNWWQTEVRVSPRVHLGGPTRLLGLLTRAWVTQRQLHHHSPTPPLVMTPKSGNPGAYCITDRQLSR